MHEAFGDLDGDTGGEAAEVYVLAKDIVRGLRERGLTLGIMESATGGAIASALTNQDHASECLRGSIVAYTPEVKIAFGVPAETIETYGVISRQTADAMAAAARARLGADIGIGLTGIAGQDKLEGQAPGTMHIALCDGERTDYTVTRQYRGRVNSKRHGVLKALTLLRTYLDSKS